jgi:ATP-dependent Clp protease ATP-binding subunit ClpA
LFERFTDRARRVVVLSQEEARLLSHNYIGTEHILLGLIAEREGVAARALEELEISLEAVRGQVQEIIGEGQENPSGHIPFTPRAKKVLELSLREALQLGHSYIGTEHILLGLVREGEGVAAQVLVKLGAHLDRVRRQVIELLEDYAGKGQAHPEGLTGSGARVQTTPLMDDDSARVMDNARRIAGRTGHEEVRPSDILLGLLASSDLDVAVILQRLGVDLRLLKERLDEMTAAQGEGRAEGPEDEAKTEPGEPEVGGESSAEES